MSCGLSQGVVWCQIDAFWLGFLAILLGLSVIQGVVLWRYARRNVSRQSQADSPSDSGPTTQTAAQKLTEQTDGGSVPPAPGSPSGGAFGWDPTERERVRWDGDSGSLPYGDGDEI